MTDEEISKKADDFSSNLDMKQGYETAWKQARDYYEKGAKPLKNKIFIEEIKLYKPNLNKQLLSKENAEFIWTFMPTWVKFHKPGMEPHHYVSHSEEEDKKIIEKIRYILFND